MGQSYRLIREKMEAYGLMETIDGSTVLNKRGKAAIRTLKEGSAQKKHIIENNEDVKNLCDCFGIRYEEITFNQDGREMLEIYNYNLQKVLIYKVTSYNVVICN